MKTTIALLVVLLLGVSGLFFYDHMTLTKKNDALSSNILNMQSAAAKQTTTIRAILGCVNATESAYVKTKTYFSPITCIKNKTSN